MTEPLEIVNALYSGFLERGLRYFFPDSRVELTGASAEARPSLEFECRPDGTVVLDWMGRRYAVHPRPAPLSENQMRLIGAMGAVLSARYRSIFAGSSPGITARLFEGLTEDRYVSAFLDHFPYLDENALPTERDVVADALEVLRETSLITYENRRVSTGVLLLGAGRHPHHPARPRPEGAIPYTNALVAIKSFHRLCDGLRTVFLVDQDGFLIDLVDITDWTNADAAVRLPAPTSARYHPHALSTMEGGNICLVLTPNGEIKVFAGGAQVFNFMEGRWRLTDAAEKYHVWHRAVGNVPLAERLFTTALNLAEQRRGGLFVVLHGPESALELVSPADLLDGDSPADETAKPLIHYLLRGKRVLELAPSILESIARMDGGIVLDSGSNLLAFGAILHTGGPPAPPQAIEGGRTTAAVAASRFGKVLKISEDGLVSFYSGGAAVWEI